MKGWPGRWVLVGLFGWGWLGCDQAPVPNKMDLATKAAQLLNLAQAIEAKDLLQSKKLEQQALELLTKAASENNHTVAASEDGGVIASRYGIRFESLQALNPNVNFVELPAGKIVQIPGHPAAQFNLAAMHQSGQAGLSKDMKLVANWYRQAAEQGFTNAEFMLGRCYQKGWGVVADSELTVNWYQKAARKGFVPALHNLGAMYAKGEGVPRDMVQAWKWYTLAEKRAALAAGNPGVPKGNPDQNSKVKAQDDASQAKKLLLDMKLMTAQQQAEGEQLARDFSFEKDPWAKSMP